MEYRNTEIILSLKRRILLFLKSNPNISVKEVALMSGFSVKHIRDLFFRQTGVTIGKYIKQCLFSKAIILLVLTRKSILDISIDVGFSTQQSFSRAFKKKFSLSPMKYRKRGIIDSQKLIKEFDSGHEFIYNGKIFLPSIKTRTSFIRFTDSVLGPGNTFTEKKRLHKIKESLSKNNYIFIISFITPMINKCKEIYINSFFCSPEETGNEFSTASGIYHKIKFNGSLNDYINTGRNLVFYIDIPFPLEIIEVIEKNKDAFTIIIFIPKRE
ncbi:helix-turn-helix domain-containing protein [Escherichia coli]|nr:helix-turn-helix transcriptional regulator [Escherichia coli]